MTRGWLYAWGSGSIALGGASLVVPLYVVALGGTPLTLGVLAAVAAFVGVPGALLFGRLADRTGKRRGVVLGALALVAAMLVVIPAVDSIAVVVAANGVVWFAFAAATPVLTLLAVTDAPEEGWSERIAELNKFQGVGWAVGLLIGAVWTAGAAAILGEAAVLRGFLLLSAGCVAAGLLAGVRSVPADPTPEVGHGDQTGRGGSAPHDGEGRHGEGARSGDGPPPTAPPSPSATRVRRALREADRFSVRTVTFPFTVGRAEFRGLHPRRFVERFTPVLAAYFGAVFLFFAGFAAFFAPLPAFLTAAGYDSGEVFALYLVSSLAAAACFGLAGRLSAKHDVSLLQAGGLLVRGVVLPPVAVVGVVVGSATVGFATTAVIFAVIGVTWAVIAVTAGTLVTQLTPPVVRGEALGMYAALGAFAGGVGSVLGGWLAAASYQLAFGAAGLLVLVGAGVVLVVRRRSLRERAPGDVTPTTGGERIEV